LSGSETWYVILFRLPVSEKKVLGRTFASKNKEKEAEEKMRNVPNCTLRQILRAVKSRTRWVGHLAHMGAGTSYELKVTSWASSKKGHQNEIYLITFGEASHAIINQSKLRDQSHLVCASSFHGQGSSKRVTAVSDLFTCLAVQTNKLINRFYTGHASKQNTKEHKYEHLYVPNTTAIVSNAWLYEWVVREMRKN
jgi:hypothetical protein